MTGYFLVIEHHSVNAVHEQSLACCRMAQSAIRKTSLDSYILPETATYHFAMIQYTAMMFQEILRWYAIAVDEQEIAFSVTLVDEFHTCVPVGSGIETKDTVSGMNRFNAGTIHRTDPGLNRPVQVLRTVEYNYHMIVSLNLLCQFT